MCRRAKLVVSLGLVATMAIFYYAAVTIGINTDTEDMLSPDLAFRKNSAALKAAFPQNSKNIVIVLDGPNPDQLRDAANSLKIQLSKSPALFGEVFDPIGHPFFGQNGFLYFDVDELSDLIDRLTQAQPFLGKLWASPTLPGLFDILGLVIDESAKGNGAGSLQAAGGILNAVSRALDDQAAGKPGRLSWHETFSGLKVLKEDSYRSIIIQPRLNFGSLQPGSEAIDAIRKIVKELEFSKKFNVRVRLTGAVSLQQEELKSVVDGLGLAGFLSFALVLCLLSWGYKSVRLVLATLVTLIAGLIWTAGYAALVVGTLNLISVAFAVLFIGLSVDFGIHYCLRYREEVQNGVPTDAALTRAASDVGGALALSAIAAAIGFFAFLPTDYRGLAELGLIAGGGMFIALFANLSLLPALLTLMPLKANTRIPGPANDNDPAMLVRRFAKPIVGVAVLLGIGSLYFATQVRFDFDPLNLKDPKVESVGTLFDMMDAGSAGPYIINILADDAKSAKIIGARLSKLKTVDQVISINSFVPDGQEEKLDLIESASFALLPAMSGKNDAKKSSVAERKSAFEVLRDTVNSNAGKMKGDIAIAAKTLQTALEKFEKKTALTSDQLTNLEVRLVSTLGGRLKELKAALLATPVSMENIPQQFKKRQIAFDGRAKIQVFPKENMRVRENLNRFVADVQSIAPNAAGTPVVILEAGTVVVNAFIQAAGLSVILITLLVLFLTHGVREIILIYAPLFLAALLTMSASVLGNLPFNFANVIVLPLLFGLGIASGIHLVLRDRGVGADEDMLKTSTPRAVVFSALTTIGSFGSIALSSHPGTSSMGVLLTIAISLTLICTLMVLPAMMTIWPARSNHHQMETFDGG